MHLDILLISQSKVILSHNSRGNIIDITQCNAASIVSELNREIQSNLQVTDMLQQPVRKTN